MKVGLAYMMNGQLEWLGTIFFSADFSNSRTSTEAKGRDNVLKKTQ